MPTYNNKMMSLSNKKRFDVTLYFRYHHEVICTCALYIYLTKHLGYMTVGMILRVISSICDISLRIVHFVKLIEYWGYSCLNVLVWPSSDNVFCNIIYKQICYLSGKFYCVVCINKMSTKIVQNKSYYYISSYFILSRYVSNIVRHK